MFCLQKMYNIVSFSSKDDYSFWMIIHYWKLSTKNAFTHNVSEQPLRQLIIQMFC